MTALMERLVEIAGQLPPEQQDALAANWFADVQPATVGEPLRVELAARLREYRANPQNVLTWEQVQARIRERLAR